MTLKEVLEALHFLADPNLIAARQKRFGIVSKNALGIAIADINPIAKKIKRNTALGLELIDSDIYEAKILASKIINPKDVTEKQMDTWVKQFDNWEYCDSFCMQLFSSTPYAPKKIADWATSEKEFIKRAAFATIASLCMEDKKSDNEKFIPYFSLIEKAATDDRLYVKKAVNWALRGLGKRNTDLHEMAIALSEELLEFDNKAAQWIAKDALRELQSEKIRIAQYPRSKYER